MWCLASLAKAKRPEREGTMLIGTGAWEELEEKLICLGAWRNGRRCGLRKLSLDGEIYQVDALKLRET